MKILHLIYDHINNPWVGGGGAVRAYEINKRLTKKGHEITIISGKYKGSKDYEEGTLRYKFLGSDRNYFISVFSYAYEVINFLKKHAKEYDIVVEDFAPWNPVFSKFFHKRAVLQVHQKEGLNIFKRYFVFGVPFMIIESFYPRIYDKIITVSEESRKKFNVKAVVISNGISKELLEQEIVKGEYIGYMGRIDMFHKGLDLLVRAFKKINFPLYIAGKGKDEEKLKRMISLLGLNEKVKYIGFISGVEKENFIKNSLFIVMPSRYEGYPLVALESASLGKPLIVSDIPELRYVVENGFGVSFSSGDVKSLKQAIEYMLSNQALIKEMGKAGKEFAKHFTWENVVEEYEKCLLEVLKS